MFWVRTAEGCCCFFFYRGSTNMFLLTCINYELIHQNVSFLQTYSCFDTLKLLTSMESGNTWKSLNEYIVSICIQNPLL